MLIRFTGPEGAPFVGKDVDVVTIHGASLEDLAALQRGTKKTMPQIMAALTPTESTESAEGTAPTGEEPVEDPYNDVADTASTANEMFQMQVAVFLALRTAGYRIHWRVARDIKFGDFDFIDDEVDLDDDAAEEDATTRPDLTVEPTVDPQVAATASAPDAIAADMPTPKAVSPDSPL